MEKAYKAFTYVGITAIVVALVGGILFNFQLIGYTGLAIYATLVAILTLISVCGRSYLSNRTKKDFSKKS